MGSPGKKGLIITILLVLAAAFTPIQYAPIAFFILLLWAFFHRANIVTALAATAIFAFSMGISGVILGLGFAHSILVTFRTVSIILPVYVYFSSNSMQDVMDTLESFGVPRDFAFMFSISIPYAHVLGRKAQHVGIAQKSRGSRSPWSIIMPLLNFVFERAKMLSISIESRGWSPSASPGRKE